MQIFYIGTSVMNSINCHELESSEELSVQDLFIQSSVFKLKQKGMGCVLGYFRRNAHLNSLMYLGGGRVKFFYWWSLRPFNGQLYLFKHIYSTYSSNAIISLPLSKYVTVLLCQ